MLEMWTAAQACEPDRPRVLYYKLQLRVFSRTNQFNLHLTNIMAYVENGGNGVKRGIIQIN